MNLLDDHRPFTLNLSCVKCRLKCQFIENVHALCQIHRTRPGIEAGVLFRRERIKHSSARFDRAHDLPHRTPFRPFENEMLDKVSNAGFISLLLTRAHVDVESYTY